MKTIITAAALLIASSTVSAWDMPFFGNGSNANNSAFGGNAITDTAGNGAQKGSGSAEGEGEFSFAMSFKGRGSSKMDSASTSDWKGNAKGDYNSNAETAANSLTKSNYAPFGYNPNNAAPVAVQAQSPVAVQAQAPVAAQVQAPVVAK